jgi:hypothetical protein
MGLEAGLLQRLSAGSSAEAWREIVAQTLTITSAPLTPGSAPSEVIKRDREIGALDHFLSSCGWDLWEAFGSSVERTSQRLARWWQEPYNAKAVLILDGLSLRELPWLLQGAQERGYTVHEVSAHASELPGETNEFARALGFGSRSQLQNNGGGASHKLQPAHTETVDLPWNDCARLVNGEPNWIFWHHWPDSKVHSLSGAGQGLDTLTRDTVAQLTSGDFWVLVDSLATGRHLVITSDHGYAATGYFHDAPGEVGQFLKDAFSSGRCVPGDGDTGPFVPPVALAVHSPHGPHRMALGRWKWKSQGGYPTLTHGGLSLLEVLSPFVLLTK